MVIAVTETGTGRCNTRFGTDTAGPHTVWIFAPGEYHSGTVPQEGHWNYRGIYIESLGLDSLSQVFSGVERPGLWVPPGLYRDSELAKLLVSAHRSAHQKLPDMTRQARWWAAMELLLTRYGEPKPHIAILGNEQAKMARVRDYIAAHYTRNLRVDELVPLCNLSRYHLMRSFARTYGMPPHAYANQLRLLEAKRLISGGIRPALAAVTVGFFDQGHLTKLFKRAYGMTPGAYASLRDAA